ncbi:response regulator [Thermodesulfobacteriota bacterium]
MAYILIIDDNKNFRDLLQNFFEDNGYETAAAPDGGQGIKLFLSRPADLVITDILMPEKEGIETIRELRQDCPDIKIIAVSGGGSIQAESCLKMALRFGAVEAFLKPVGLTELLGAVQKHLAE